MSERFMHDISVVFDRLNGANRLCDTAKACYNTAIECVDLWIDTNDYHRRFLEAYDDWTIYAMGGDFHIKEYLVTPSGMILITFDCPASQWRPAEPPRIPDSSVTRISCEPPPQAASGYVDDDGATGIWMR